MADDIRENAMAGGIPARLRGLAANGNSISPTLEEVMKAMGIYIFSLTLAVDEEKDLGNLGYGMYLVASSTVGASAIFVCGSSKECIASDVGQKEFAIMQMRPSELYLGERKQMGTSLSKTMALMYLV